MFLRTNNHSIPDEVLDFMKDVSLAALQSQNSGKPIFSGSLPVAEQGVIDEYGHHTEWKFCPGCGIDLDLETGAEQFGCWSCGFVRQ